MKFMLMLYADEKAGAAIPPAEMSKFMDMMYAYEATLTKAGVHVQNAGLAMTPEARTIGFENGELKVHAGPYAETVEQLGGYYLIDCADMDEAIKWATHCPGAQWGKVEIRPYARGF